MRYLIIACVLVSLSADLAAQATRSVASTTTAIGIGDRGISALQRRQRNFVAAAGPLYSIEFAEPAARVSASEAASMSVAADPTGSLNIETQHQKPFPFTVTCRLSPERESPFILGRISVRSEQLFRIASVTFPSLHLALPLSGTGSDDAVVLPECDGVTMLDPLKNNLARELPYPGTASMQFLGAYDKSAGVYLASRDGEGYAKRLAAHRRDKALILSLRHLPAQTPAKEWSLPYDAAITTFDVAGGAGWEVAADLYRQWATQQRWCRATLAQRFASGDIPRWLGEPSLFYAFSLYGNLPAGKDGPRLPLVVDHAEAWRKVVGGPVTFMLMSWEKRGPWVAPDYFPPTGNGDDFTASTRALRDKGHRSLVFLSGLNWTLRKTQRGPFAAIDDQAEFTRLGRPHAISDIGGEPIIYGKPAEDVGQYARICPATPLADALLRDTSLRCQEFGIDVVQADQLVGGGSPACSHPEHQHPRAGGNWSARALYDAFARTRDAGKAKSRDYAFSIEEPGEFFIPLLDVYHARDYMQNRWPRTGAGAFGVPLFTHVYHDYCLGYGGDSTGVTATPSETALYAQAMNLVCGKAPAVCVWTRWLDPATVDAAQQRLLRSHFDLWRGPAREFLVHGRRVTGMPPDVPTLSITFGSSTTARQTFAIPSALTSTYELPDGRRGVVLACIAREASFVLIEGRTIRLEPGEAVFRQLK